MLGQIFRSTFGEGIEGGSQGSNLGGSVGVDSMLDARVVGEESEELDFAKDGEVEKTSVPFEASKIELCIKVKTGKERSNS